MIYGNHLHTVRSTNEIGCKVLKIYSHLDEFNFYFVFMNCFGKCPTSKLITVWFCNFEKHALADKPLLLFETLKIYLLSHSNVKKAFGNMFITGWSWQCKHLRYHIRHSLRNMPNLWNDPFLLLKLVGLEGITSNLTPKYAQLFETTQSLRSGSLYLKF